ncbi:NAD(P)H-dependent oxidoreductase [Streptomyces sp. B6B3]|uniref:NADPH-dependent FMN reductase n=1 Tax=Streptomyces sp. B6B3 TaxID=3153570 RepID=UPI00325EFDE9
MTGERRWAALQPLRLGVIVGSTRPGRVGDRIAAWFVERARIRPDVEVDVLDLVEFDFPSRHPTEPTPEMLRFTDAVARAEAFVVVTPEYNRGYPASLKQAIDYAYEEWHAKPVGFVSYGSNSHGLYAVEALRSVFTELHTVTMRDGVSLDLLAGGAEQTLPEGLGHAATALLDELGWWGVALREARSRRPYVA